MKEFGPDCLDNLLHRIFDASSFNLTHKIETHPGAVPDLSAEILGPDTLYLLARNAELLRAIEHLAFEMRGLAPDQHDLIFIDAGNFKRDRRQALQKLAHEATLSVRQTGHAFTFQPMSSHERRQLHLALASTGLRTASAGDGPHRAVVLHPEVAN